MTDPTIKASIRLRERAEDLLLHGNLTDEEKKMPAMMLAILEEFDRINTVLRKHNLQ